jgi:hypothetical protein
MAEFMYYEIDADAVTPTVRKRLFAIPSLRMRLDVDGKEWLVRSTEPVPTFKGRRVVKEDRWNATLEPRPRLPTRGSVTDLVARRWAIEPGARKAELARKLLATKRSSVQLTFGDGQSDAVSIGVDTTLPNGTSGVHLELQAPGAVTLRVSPSLRSSRGRPLAIFEAKDASGTGRLLLDWELPELSDDDRGRVAQLSLTLSTEADRAIVLIDSVAFST